MPEYLEKTEFQASRAFSPAVITQGGRIAWLAGQTATRDDAGNDISCQFEAQVCTIFGLIDQTLQRCGGSLANLVTMTVFINDPRHGDRFVELRKGFFPDGNYPASAMITVSHFARPGMLIEIQGVAVMGDDRVVAPRARRRLSISSYRSRSHPRMPVIILPPKFTLGCVMLMMYSTSPSIL